MTIPKQKRNPLPKLRKSAKGEECTCHVPGVCDWGHETTIWAHLPSDNKGMGVKDIDDWWGVYACAGCHDFLDGRRISPYMDAGDKPNIMLKARERTERRLIEKGLLKIEGLL